MKKDREGGKAGRASGDFLRAAREHDGVCRPASRHGQGIYGVVRDEVCGLGFRVERIRPRPLRGFVAIELLNQLVDLRGVLGDSSVSNDPLSRSYCVYWKAGSDECDKPTEFSPINGSLPHEQERANKLFSFNSLRYTEYDQPFHHVLLIWINNPAIRLCNPNLYLGLPVHDINHHLCYHQKGRQILVIIAEAN